MASNKKGPWSSFSPHAPLNIWSAATRHRMARKAATSRRTPQTHPIGLNDDQGRKKKVSSNGATKERKKTIRN